MVVLLPSLLDKTWIGENDLLVCRGRLRLHFWLFNGRQLLVLRVYNSPVYEKAKVPKVDSLTEVEQDANEGLKMGLS